MHLIPSSSMRTPAAIGRAAASGADVALISRGGYGLTRILPQLPRTVLQPRIDRFDPDAAPVLSLAVSASKPVRDITEFADKVLRRQLESVSGVGQVVVLGGLPGPSVGRIGVDLGRHAHRDRRAKRG